MTKLCNYTRLKCGNELKAPQRSAAGVGPDIARYCIGRMTMLLTILALQLAFDAPSSVRVLGRRQLLGLSSAALAGMVPTMPVCCERL
jgi:hypothetical protein